MSSSAQTLAAKIKLGWNMGNSMEAVLKNSDGSYLKLDGVAPENSWGNASVSNELMQRVKQSGFDAVRFPSHGINMPIKPPLKLTRLG